MKKSELKAMIRESVKDALIEILPSVIRTINESVGYNDTTPNTLTDNVRKAPKMTDFTSKIHVEGGSPYGDVNTQLPTMTSITKPVKKAALPPPQKVDRREGIVNGEKYISGDGILEWFAKTGGPLEQTGEFEHTDDDVDNLISGILGRG